METYTYNQRLTGIFATTRSLNLASQTAHKLRRMYFAKAEMTRTPRVYDTVPERRITYECHCADGGITLEVLYGVHMFSADINITLRVGAAHKSGLDAILSSAGFAPCPQHQPTGLGPYGKRL